MGGGGLPDVAPRLLAIRAVTHDDVGDRAMCECGAAKMSLMHCVWTSRRATPPAARAAGLTARAAEAAAWFTDSRREQLGAATAGRRSWSAYS